LAGLFFDIDLFVGPVGNLEAHDEHFAVGANAEVSARPL
jgi:hypothetical protein